MSDEIYDICKRYIEIRKHLRTCITRSMEPASEKGTPPMRPLFFDFPSDEHTWKIEDAYMFGSELLVAPILFENRRFRDVCLPTETNWENAWTGESFTGGQTISVDAPIEKIPLVIKKRFLAGYCVGIIPANETGGGNDPGQN